MGRLYQKNVSGENTLAYFENGKVWIEKRPSDTIIHYDSTGRIFMSLPERTSCTIATCDNKGKIRKGRNGAQIANCEDGRLYEGHSRSAVLAWYDGDMYGAAAAAVVVVLRLEDELNPPLHRRT